MIVPDRVRKCVVFLGYEMADGTTRLAGSAFFFGKDGEGEKATDVFLVTARHVIDGIRSLGIADVLIRGNATTGNTSWAKCKTSEWLVHPTDKSIDVAVIRGGVPDGWDHLVIPVSMCVSQEVFEKHEIGLGDEVFVTGLFRHHHGMKKNIPIVRVGNLAATTEEKVATKHFGLVDAYLIEARSIGGLSGSPVFLNLGVVRSIAKQVKHSTGGPIFFLLGLIHGHYDVESNAVDQSEATSLDSLSIDRINTGIAIVVPIDKVNEVIDSHGAGDG